MSGANQRVNLRETARGVAFDVEVKVRAKQTRIVGAREGRLSVALSSPPVDGAANDALRETLAECFGVPLGRVAIVLGERHRRKVVELRGLTSPEALAVFARLLG